MKRAPSIFIGHGSPMNVIEENIFNHNMRSVGATLDHQNIRAILCLSAHYQTEGLVINDSDNPKTIYDFRGFPEELYHMQYDAPGSKQIAQEIAQTLGIKDLELNNEWGYDHGAWNILWHLQPQKKIPVIMMSLNYHYSLNEHFQLGVKLRQLRDRGIMILGSGNIVHSFKGVQFKSQAPVHSQAQAFNNFVIEKIQSKKFQDLIQFPEYIYEAAKFSVNSSEHYIPLLYILGSSYDEENEVIFNNEIVMSTMSMLSLSYGI